MQPCRWRLRGCAVLHEGTVMQVRVWRRAARRPAAPDGERQHADHQQQERLHSPAVDVELGHGCCGPRAGRGERLAVKSQITGCRDAVRGLVAFQPLPRRSEPVPLSLTPALPPQGRAWALATLAGDLLPARGLFACP